MNVMVLGADIESIILLLLVQCSNLPFHNYYSRININRIIIFFKYKNLRLDYTIRKNDILLILNFTNVSISCFSAK